MILKAAAATVFALTISTAVHAEPCGAPAPALGAVIHGPVLQVTDGDHICVATGAARADWVELLIRGADEGPADASDKLGPALLMSVAFARTADCTVVADAQGHRRADCRIDGRPLDELMRRPGALEAANAWIKPRTIDAAIQLASR